MAIEKKRCDHMIHRSRVPFGICVFEFVFSAMHRENQSLINIAAGHTHKN
jgi:hypothetical protein